MYQGKGMKGGLVASHANASDAEMNRVGVDEGDEPMEESTGLAVGTKFHKYQYLGRTTSNEDKDQEEEQKVRDIAKQTGQRTEEAR